MGWCSQVTEALKGSEFLAVDDKNKRVRRAVALEFPEEAKAQAEERTVYASPFPFDVTLEPLQAFFSRIDKVNCVRMRRHLHTKEFRGSIFVEFATDEGAAKVMDQSQQCFKDVRSGASVRKWEGFFPPGRQD